MALSACLNTRDIKTHVYTHTQSQLYQYKAGQGDTDRGSEQILCLGRLLGGSSFCTFDRVCVETDICQVGLQLIPRDSPVLISMQYMDGEGVPGSLGIPSCVT